VKQYPGRYVKVVKILRRTGSRGRVQQVRVEFLDDSDRSMVRNVIVMPVPERRVDVGSGEGRGCSLLDGS